MNRIAWLRELLFAIETESCPNENQTTNQNQREHETILTYLRDNPT